jgi:hypothetical protein
MFSERIRRNSTVLMFFPLSPPLYGKNKDFTFSLDKISVLTINYKFSINKSMVLVAIQIID